MYTSSRQQFTLGELAGPEYRRFADSTEAALVGRCLLDSIEYLRTDLRWPGRFEQLKLAHAIRLVTTCLKSFPNQPVAKRFEVLVAPAYRALRSSRKSEPPFYGDDFWDWASIVDALKVVADAYPRMADDRENSQDDVNELYEAVKARTRQGLTFGGRGEWFGPAVPAMVYYVLAKYRSEIQNGGREVDAVLTTLKSQAMIRIVGDKFMRRSVSPEYHAWHYGQVLGVFGRIGTQWQHKKITKLTPLEKLERDDRVYALARVLQGALVANDKRTYAKALSMLFECQQLDRPLGSGVLGDNAKGSLNVLDVLWSTVGPRAKSSVCTMLDQLWAHYKGASTIGIIVAVQRELEACKTVFRNAGATMRDETDGSVHGDHEGFKVVILVGKAVLEAHDQAKILIERHHARWLMMVGIAGALGRQEPAGRRPGPEKGDVVVGSGTGVWAVREKVRGTRSSVGVPWDGDDWEILPADPTMFRIAHGLRKAKEGTGVYEGLIITANGIRDDAEEKKEILKRWPGGLAVEEEGFSIAFVASRYGVPHLVIRGISDLAAGDKIQQQEGRGTEQVDQERAALAAAEVAVRVTEQLSYRW